MTTTHSTTGPKNIVVSLEHAKDLKKAGWPQEKPLHYWHRSVRQWCVYARDFSEHDFNMLDGANFPADIAAPTAEEILRRLPEEISFDTGSELKGSDYWLEITKSRFWGDTPWEIRYRENGSLLLWDNPEPIRADTLANAASQIYCYLAENNLLPTAA